MDKIDPEKNFEVHYYIPSIVDLPNHCEHLRNQRFDELVIDGVCEHNMRNRRNRTNISEPYAFRCVAEYRLIDHEKEPKFDWKGPIPNLD